MNRRTLVLSALVASGISIPPRSCCSSRKGGRLQELGKPIKDVPQGQPVLTKPNVLHWHGAAPDQSALQFSVFSGTLEWKEKVTDEEYTGKTIRRH